MKRLTLLFAASLALLPLVAETVRVADCERDPKLDFWAAEDNEFCWAVMDDVFRAAGLTAERIGFGEDHMADLSGADVDVGSTYDMSLFANVISKPVTTDKLRALFS